MSKNTNSEYLDKTLKAARKLQARYNNLNSPGSQRVRNPYPMHQLVMNSLPVVPDPNAVVEGVITQTFLVNGKKHITNTRTFTTMNELLGVGYIAKVALTKYDLDIQLREKGYTVNSVACISQALAQLKAAGLIGSITAPRPITQKRGRGRGLSIYFRKDTVTA